jgi:prevent-host-death family protein
MYIVYIVELTYTLDMDDIVRMGTKEFRDDIGHRVEAAHFRREPTIVTRNDEPRAVLISYAEWAALRPAKPNSSAPVD